MPPPTKVAETVGSGRATPFSNTVAEQSTLPPVASVLMLKDTSCTSFIVAVIVGPPAFTYEEGGEVIEILESTEATSGGRNDPAGPVAPVGPVGPCTPVAPVAPVVPVAPCGP